MLTLIFAESALERVPEVLWRHPSVYKQAQRLNKKPDQILLDRSFHHAAMLKLKDGVRRGRPDIVHFSLLNALGTPLNKEKLLNTYVHTIDDYIISLNPEVRLPRNYDRFVGLIEQLYDLGKITEGDRPLLELRKGNLQSLVEDIKPSYIVALTRMGKPQLLHRTMRALIKMENPVAIIGGFPRGHFSDETTKISNELVSIDSETLEAWIVVSRLIYEYERAIRLPERRLSRLGDGKTI